MNLSVGLLLVVVSTAMFLLAGGCHTLVNIKNVSALVAALWSSESRERFEALVLQAIEPKAEAVALSVNDVHPFTVAIQKNKKHEVEHGDVDIQLDQRSKAVDGLSEIYRLGVEVHFFDFGVGSYHEVVAPEKNREHSTKLQLSVWNVVFMRRLPI
ncbi:hypothetical protein ALQ58_101214 [Pseudomonas syringae pv. apii]|nr:hypothetical protein ALQ58_101214 [Pseudomonas syringae pv. apii]